MAFLAAAAPAIGIAGAGLSALGTFSSAEATGNAAAYQAQVAKNNQVVANQNATYAEEAGEQQAAATSLKGAATMGKIKAAQGASGVSVNSGSAVNVRESAAETGQLDTETVLNNAELTAYGYRTQATNYGAEAGLEEMEAEEAPIAGALGAAGNLLSSASGIASKWGGAPSGPGAPLNILPT